MLRVPGAPGPFCASWAPGATRETITGFLTFVWCGTGIGGEQGGGGRAAQGAARRAWG